MFYSKDRMNGNFSNLNHSNRGMFLEDLINEANRYYLENDIGIIYKKATPIGLVDVDYNDKSIKRAYFKEKSTLDYNGLYRSSYIEFDAKESLNKTSFPLSNIKPHQFDHLKMILNHGGIGFLIIHINDVYYLLKGDDLLNFVKNNERKSIPIKYLEENCRKIDLTLNPVLDYLKVVDEIYFKGENKND